MDPHVAENITKTSNSSALADIAALQQQQQLQQFQQQKIKTEDGLTSPMDTSGPSHLHGNALSRNATAAAEHHSEGAAGISPGVSFSARGQGVGVPPAMASTASASQLGANLQHGAVLPGGRLGYRGLKRTREKPHGQDYYCRQLRRMKRMIKDFIFLNSSVCDEVIRVEEKLARVKEERRYLLRKLLQYQSANEGTNPLTAEPHPAPVGAKSAKSPAGHGSTPDHAPEITKKSATKKKAAGAGGGGGGGESKKKLPSQAAKDLLESLQSKPKKSKSQSNRKTIPPMQLDSLGRPVFPMMLGDLTLHSIGEIVPDRNTFNSHDCIYPAGFCSTRVFASMTRPHEKCLYTCKISDCGDLPEFEIAPEEGTEQVFRGSTPNECHVQLLQTINAALGADIVSVVGHGADFFGLTNPVIQNLIQSCPGAKKCSGYKWIRFEINKAETNENVAVGKNDPTISIDAFHKLLQQAGAVKPVTFSPPSEHSTNLRSLLTKGSVPFTGQM